MLLVVVVVVVVVMMMMMMMMVLDGQVPLHDTQNANIQDSHDNGEIKYCNYYG